MKSTFICGECSLFEEGLTKKELSQLSEEHFKGNHIDIDELRELKKQQEKRE